MREADDIPDNEQHPELHHCIVALLGVLDAYDALRVRHDETSGEYTCDCDRCDDARGQLYAVEGFITAYRSNIRIGSLVYQAELQHQQHQQARRAGRLTAVSIPHAPMPEEPYPCEDPELHHAMMRFLEFKDHADALRVRHDAEEGQECQCVYCGHLRGQMYLVRYFEGWLDGDGGRDPITEAFRQQCNEQARARRVAVEAGRRPGRTKKPFGGIDDE